MRTTQKVELNACSTGKTVPKSGSLKMNHIPLPVLIGLVAVVVAGCLYYFLKVRPQRGLSDFDRLLGKTKPSKPNRPKSSNPQEVARLTQELSSRFFHDKEKVKDAVAYERERNPSGSEEELLRAAIYRWDRLSN
jgi:hypothetical protein